MFIDAVKPFFKTASFETIIVKRIIVSNGYI